ncbi:MAG: hypothetical protein ACYTGN_12730 [Planctomycetota bacterium]|jgi:hypothetical protein
MKVLALMLLFAACAPQRTDSGTTFHFDEGGGFDYSVDDQPVLTIRARNGRLYCNGVDTGPYAPKTPVRILSATEIVVGAERRSVPANQSG